MVAARDADSAGADRSDAEVGKFLVALAHERNASPHTLDASRRDLATLCRLAGEKPPTSLCTQDIRRFAMQLHGGGLSARSIARTLSAWRSFYRWLGKQLPLKLNPCQGVRPPKRRQDLPKALGIDQAQALLDEQPENLGGQSNELLDLRDKAMFELFYSSGLRLSELDSLDLGPALNLDEGEVTVTGKRGKTRAVPLGTQATATLRAWIERRGELAESNEMALFISRRGTRITPRMIQLRLARWAQRQGLGQHVHPHMLRHSFASHLLQSSGDLRAVQEMLGHANIGTTQIYTHLDFQHLAKVYDAAHPRAHKKG